MAGESSIYLNFLVAVLKIAPIIDLAIATETSLKGVRGSFEAGTEPGSLLAVNSISMGNSYRVMISGMEKTPLWSKYELLYSSGLISTENFMLNSHGNRYLLPLRSRSRKQLPRFVPSTE